MPDRTPLAVAWRDRIGGPNAVSVAAWAWLLPWGVWTTVAFQPSWHIWDTLGWTLVGLVAHSATGIVLLIGYFTYLHARSRPPRPLAAILTFAAAGCARGATVGLLSVAIGLTPTAQLVFRVPAGALLTVVWFIIATVTVDTARRHGELLAALRQRRAELEATRQQSNSQLVHWRQELVQEVRITLRAAFETSDEASAHERLRTIAEDVVRPLSHQVAQRRVDERLTQVTQPDTSVEQAPRPWMQHIQRAILETPFPLAIPTVVTVFTGAPVLIYAMRSMIGLGVAAILGSVVLLMYALAGALIRRTAATWPPTVRLTVTAFVWFWTAWAVAQMLTSISAVTAIAPSAFVAAMGSVVCVTVVGSLVASFERHRKQTIQALRSIVDALDHEADYLRLRLERERDRLVRLLHGGVHARITGMAMQLAQTRSLGDLSFNDLADSLQQQCLRELATHVDEPIEVRLKTICDVWRVVMHVELHLDPTARRWLDDDPVAADNLVEVVREALANAARHAQATRADISIRTTADLRVTVNVWDNGAANPDDETRPGLGTEILHQCTAEWELVRGSGATLHAQIDVHARLEAVS